jgi:hypothetical protein
MNRVKAKAAEEKIKQVNLCNIVINISFYLIYFYVSIFISNLSKGKGNERIRRIKQAK